MGVAVLILGLVCLSLFALKGIPIVIAAFLSSLIVMLLSGLDVLTTFKTVFMPGMTAFITNYFIIFLLGAFFGKIVELSGAAETISRTITGRFGEKYVAAGVIIAAAILTMGGVSVYVALFALYPISMSLFKQADMPRRLFAACYMCGAGTFTMTGPFSPAIQNVIPTTYLGTTVAAAAVPGVITAVFCAVLGILYMQWRVKKVRLAGEHFVSLTEDVVIQEDAKRPNFILSILPLVILIFTLNVLKFPIEGALLAGVISGIVLYFPYIPKDFKFLVKSFYQAITDATMAITNTGTTVGFGKVVASTAAFAGLIPAVTNLGGNPLVAAAVATTCLAGISGSSSGGLGIATPLIGQIFLPLGVNAQALHRVLTVASSGLDSMPHNGGVVTFLNFSKTTHKEGYFDIFIVSVVITLLQTILLLILISAMGMTWA
ncbi:GntP family permease [Papillibacter cinnamivorans]|uniref:H+/gluconate symporter n=1 Tax=Papillibacter cinnamivorans DSM 12816 TaxID=1122930 RepID=A0A1W1ZL55_9FIRM|nr:GntP family permease [Papillibacter cinnamivorans]SMC49169.1 H+/gluconate symporter [Papillibacter cinnamivorans DSM 12816]